MWAQHDPRVVSVRSGCHVPASAANTVSIACRAPVPRSRLPRLVGGFGSLTDSRRQDAQRAGADGVLHRCGPQVLTIGTAREGMDPFDADL